LKETIDEWTT